jgi:acetyl-CoA/propionyl-CoA carboxylase biotin carboxyl carrier protein
MSLGTSDGGVAVVAVKGDVGAGEVLVSVDGGPERTASLDFIARHHTLLTLDGEAREYAAAPVYTGPATPGWSNPAPGAPTELFLGSDGWSCGLQVLSREAKLARVLSAIQREEGAADPAVRSPMPGTVVSVSVGDGERVEAGQVLLAVEAMKMEHQLLAPLDGTVHITTRSGDLVKADQVLATIHPEPHGEQHPEPDPEQHPEPEPEQEPRSEQGQKHQNPIITGKGA